MKALSEKYWNEAALIVLLALIIASAFIPNVRGIWFYGTEWNGEATRSIVISLGAVGAFYGLMLAARRQILGERSLFSTRLKEGVLLLGDESLALRRAGVRILGEVANSFPEKSSEREIICNIPNDFIRENLTEDARRRRALLVPMAPRELFADCETAIAIMYEIVPENKRGLIDYSNLDLSGLRLPKRLFDDHEASNP